MPPFLNTKVIRHLRISKLFMKFVQLLNFIMQLIYFYLAMIHTINQIFILCTTFIFI